ncbi:MAG: hypothetical protein M3441_26450 [Chloroflexota bacterium]|nr:hypothetical protein [Chloroflexota bacterium]
MRYFALGRVYTLQGKKAEAIEAFGNAIEASVQVDDENYMLVRQFAEKELRKLEAK